MLGDTNQVRSSEEIADAIGAFTPAQWVRLGRISAYYSSTHPKAHCSDDDLLHQAIERALEGHRRCPITVDVERFLAEAMRGIAGDEARRTENRVVGVPVASGDDGEDIADETLNAEEAAIAAENEKIREQETAALRRRS